jgi:hypothetical protein
LHWLLVALLSWLIFAIVVMIIYWCVKKFVIARSRHAPAQPSGQVATPSLNNGKPSVPETPVPGTAPRRRTL